MRVIIAFLISIVLFSCDDNGSKTLPSGNGREGELLVVADTFYWKGKTGNAIISTLGRDMDALPQDEPLFSLFNVEHRNFEKLLQRNINLLLIEIDKNAENVKLSKASDLWATNQIVLKIIGKNDQEIANYILSNSEIIETHFLEAERKRMRADIRTISDLALGKKIAEKGIEINIPSGFQIVEEKGNFVWLKQTLLKQHAGNSNEIIKNIILYSEDYVSETQFDTNYIHQLRDSLGKNYIVGNKGEYWKTEYLYNPLFRNFNHNGAYAASIKGLWKLEGFYMGGPFIQYAILDEKNAKVWYAMIFVFCPQFDKRTYVRELEAVLTGIKFPNSTKS